MDADQLSNMSVNLLGEFSAISSRDLWTWQGLIAAGCIGLPVAFGRWRGVLRRALRTTDSPRAPAAALVARVGTPAVLCALALVAYGTRHMYATSAGLLLILAWLSGAKSVSNWTRDPEDGVNNLRSDLFLAIWNAFTTKGTTSPYPQQVAHLKDPG